MDFSSLCAGASSVIGGHERRFLEPLEAKRFQPFLMRRACLQGNQQRRQVEKIADEVVDEQRVIRDIEELDHFGAIAGCGASGCSAPGACVNSPAANVASKLTAFESPWDARSCSSASSCFLRPAFSSAAKYAYKP